MRAKKAISILFIFFGILSSYGQCKNLKERPLKSWRKALILNPNIQVMTSLKSVQSFGGTNSKASFFSDDTGGNYFLLTYERAYMTDYEIQKSQKLIFYFENGMALDRKSVV